MTTPTKHNLTGDQREQILRSLLLLATPSLKLPKNAYSTVAGSFACHRDTVRRVWKRARSSGLSSTSSIANVRSRIKERCGRKSKMVAGEFETKLKALPLRSRRTLRGFMLQQDNAPSHAPWNDEELNAEFRCRSVTSACKSSKEYC